MIIHIDDARRRDRYQHVRAWARWVRIVEVIEALKPGQTTSKPPPRPA